MDWERSLRQNRHFLVFAQIKDSFLNWDVKKTMMCMWIIMKRTTSCTTWLYAYIRFHFIVTFFCFSITKCIHQVLSWIKWHVLKILFRNNAVNRSSFPVTIRLPLYRSKLTSIVCLQCYTIVIPSTQSNSFGFTRSLLQTWLVCRIDHANLDYIHIYK